MKRVFSILILFTLLMVCTEQSFCAEYDSKNPNLIETPIYQIVSVANNIASWAQIDSFGANSAVQISQFEIQAQSKMLFLALRQNDRLIRQNDEIIKLLKEYAEKPAVNLQLLEQNETIIKLLKLISEKPVENSPQSNVLNKPKKIK